MIKVFHELLEHWASTAATVQAVRPGARPRNLLVLELKNLCAYTERQSMSYLRWSALLIFLL